MEEHISGGGGEHVKFSSAFVVFEMSIGYMGAVRNIELEPRRNIWPGDIDLRTNQVCGRLRIKYNYRKKFCGMERKPWSS